MNTEVMSRDSNVSPHVPHDTSHADPMLAIIERVVTNNDLPMERLTALMDMRERQMAKEAEQVFNRSFAAAMAEMTDVPRTGHNKHLGVKYSTLDDLIRTTRPPLSRHGLSLNWETKNNGAEITVTAIVRHAEGHSISTTLSGKPDSGKQMNALQGGGSTETYLKRYTGFGILGLSSGDEVDDDGKQSAPTETINGDQYAELAQMIEKAGITEAVVCQAEKIGMLQELPSKLYGRVKANLAANIKNRSPEAA